MPRHDDESKIQRNKDICEKWVNGRSRAELAVEYGLESQTIKKILRTAGLTEEDREAVPERRAVLDRKPISTIHAQIGLDVSYHRHFMAKMKLEEFADMIQFSKSKVRQIEVGIYDFRMSELLKIATAIGKPVEQLLLRRVQ